jgi:glycosyltransferase involved in cell wall biosynthesis
MSGQRPDPFRLSVLTPMFNEEASVDALFDTLIPVLEGVTRDFEIICIDDGSRDRTVEKVRARQAREPRIKLISFTRNFGKEAALSAGVDHAEGDAVLVIDADLQHPPEMIPEMVAKWREGVDVVAAVRENRIGESLVRALPSLLFYRMFNRISDQNIPPEITDYRIMDAAVIRALRTLPERNRFMKGLFAWVGFSLASLPYGHRNRRSGNSSFNLWSLWNFALDGITSFSTWPLRIWSYFGLVIALIALTYAAWIVLRTLIWGVDVPGFASLITIILFLGSIQLISLGVLGEYIGRIMTEVKGRPIYIVRRRWGFEDNADDKSGGESGE